MKKYIILLLLILTASISAAIYYYYPAIRTDNVYSRLADEAGLVNKSRTVDDYDIHYYESASETGDVLILLHGLGGNKTAFLQSAAGLSRSFHIILPDLAGHGDNLKKGDTDYSIRGQADFLFRFVTAKKTGRFHLGGNSMGGHVSAAFAVIYPQMLKSLILINSAGLTTEGNSAYTGYMAPIKDREELLSSLSFAFLRVPDIGYAEAEYMIRNQNRTREFMQNRLIPSIRNGGCFDLSGSISRIRTPTLILWGAHDRVITVRVAEKFRSGIRNSKLVLIDDASHCPQLEVPARVAEEITEFIKNETDLESTHSTR